MRGGARRRVALSFGALQQAYAAGVAQRLSLVKADSNDELAIARAGDRAQTDIALDAVKAKQGPSAGSGAARPDLARAGARAAAGAGERARGDRGAPPSPSCSRPTRIMRPNTPTCSARSTSSPHSPPSNDSRSRRPMRARSMPTTSRASTRSPPARSHADRRADQGTGGRCAKPSPTCCCRSSRASSRRVSRAVADWAAGVLAETAATQAGEAAKTSAVLAGTAVRSGAQDTAAAASAATTGCSHRQEHRRLGGGDVCRHLRLPGAGPRPRRDRACRGRAGDGSRRRRRAAVVRRRRPGTCRPTWSRWCIAAR